jgi:hypothetical protein
MNQPTELFRKTTMNYKLRILQMTVAAAASFALTACGGGGGDDAPPATAGSTTTTTTMSTVSTAEGLWSGTTSTGRAVTGIVLDNNTYWVLYSSAGSSQVIAGAVQGTSTSAIGRFNSADGKDANLEGAGINNVTVSGTYTARQSFSGTLTYPALGQAVSFTTIFDRAYDLTPSLATVAGTYFGTAAVVGSTESAGVTITSAGQLSGTGAGGCRFSGSIAPHVKGNVYDVTVTFGGGVCSNGTSTVNGVGYFDSGAKRLYGAAVNSARSNGFIFVGTKP